MCLYLSIYLIYLSVYLATYPSIYVSIERRKRDREGDRKRENLIIVQNIKVLSITKVSKQRQLKKLPHIYAINNAEHHAIIERYLKHIVILLNNKLLNHNVMIPFMYIQTQNILEGIARYLQQQEKLFFFPSPLYYLSGFFFLTIGVYFRYSNLFKSIITNKHFCRRMLNK